MDIAVGVLSLLFITFGWQITRGCWTQVFQRHSALKRMKTARGLIVRIQRHESVSSVGTSRIYKSKSYFPVIRYCLPSGEAETFTAETGDSGATTRFAVGRSIDVLYDPMGLEQPLVKDSPWEGLVMLSLMGVITLSLGIGMAWFAWAVYTGLIETGA